MLYIIKPGNNLHIEKLMLKIDFITNVIHVFGTDYFHSC